jgi:glycosyltransferase involved in cell wall biosynthesis
MKVGVFDIHLTLKATGLGRYGYELTKRLISRTELMILKVNYRIFPKNFIKIFFAPIVLRLNNKPDILHALAPTEIAFFSGFEFPCKLVVTIHDLLPIIFPENWPTRQDFLFGRGLKNTIRNADKIIFVSNTVKKEFLKMYPTFNEQKTCVIYNGLNQQLFQPVVNAKQKVYEQFGIAEDFFLFVGRLEKRKNILILLEVIKEIHRKNKNFILLLAGPDDPFYQLNLSNYPVKRLYFVDDTQLPLLYSAAVGFVFPSLYEGFGIPVAEAMACGCPVICSDIPVLREIYDEAAIFCSPLNKNAWYQAMLQLISNQELRKKLTQNGFKKAARLSWDNAADQVFSVYNELAYNNKKYREPIRYLKK